MSTAEQIRFLQFGDRRVAYAVSGDGPPLVAAAWWVSHLELDWRDEAFRRFWDALAEGYTLVRYDRLGVGMSDREGHDAQRTVEGEVALLGRVLDELALERVVLLGGSSGGCAAISFAARFPERVERLLLYGAYADGAAISTPEVRKAIVTTVRSHWGLGSRLLADIFLGTVGSAEQERFARYQRAAASAETAARLLELIYRTDVRAELPLVQVPTVVVHRRSDRAIPYALGRELAAAVPGATLIPLEGSAHFPWAGDADSVVRTQTVAFALLRETPLNHHACGLHYRAEILTTAQLARPGRIASCGRRRSTSRSALAPARGGHRDLPDRADELRSPPRPPHDVTGPATAQPGEHPPVARISRRAAPPRGPRRCCGARPEPRTRSSPGPCLRAGAGARAR